MFNSSPMVNRPMAMRRINRQTLVVIMNRFRQTIMRINHPTSMINHQTSMINHPMSMVNPPTLVRVNNHPTVVHPTVTTMNHNSSNNPMKRANSNNCSMTKMINNIRTNNHMNLDNTIKMERSSSTMERMKMT